MKRDMLVNGFNGESLRTQRFKDVPTEKSQRNRRRQGRPPAKARWGVLVFLKDREEWSRHTLYFSTKREAQMRERGLVGVMTDFYWLSAQIGAGWRRRSDA